MEALRVLIVDDEPELVNALKERLTLRGLVADGVTTGAAALAYLEENPCDVVLLDVKMPGLGGLEVIQRIKSRWISLQVVLLTGHGSVRNVEEGMAMGAYDYLMKPVKIEALVKVIQAAAAGEASPPPKEDE
jgi:DNA-binding NtrC family response regulator